MAPRTAHDRPFLDPAVLARLGTLELKARTIVEGFLSGLHRSPFKGFSVEFAEYRQYIPGDALSTIDWKVYARSDRYVIKKFEEETASPGMYWRYSANSRSEEHTSELQSHSDLVCRLLL